MTYDTDPATTGSDAAPTGDPEERVEQLTEEIDQTRDGLTETIQAIGDKLEPGNLAREATDSVVATTRGKVDQMTYGAQETFRDVTSNPGSILDTVKSNPIPAGMIGLGVAMLFMNRGKQGQADRRFSSSPAGYRGYQSFDYGSSLPGDHGYNRRSSWEPQEWDRRSSSGQNPMERAGQTVAGVAGSAGETVSNAADEAGRRVSELADTVGETAGEIPQQAGYYVQQGSSQIRRFIDENPLGAGVIAVAAGAAIGMLLPTTDVERQTIGPARDQVVQQAESSVHQALDKVEQQTQQTQQSQQG
jgi:ElaB/YqjD/DUF883 family membrane-anchored ribosome-binding protein